MPRVSVVIPCYNQGKYLDAAVDSVLAQTFSDYEILIVNDGSTEPETCRILDRYDRPKTRVISTGNQGLAKARNNGIREAAGEYILPLDADDRIGPTYIEKAVAVADSRPEIGIVYCLAETFGAMQGAWETAEFSLKRMLLGNLIFCTALYRKSDWEAVGGYDPVMAHGWEDWDFWLSLIELGRGVHRIPEVLFFYHVKQVSMAKSMDVTRKTEMHLQVMRNHKDLYIENARPLVELYYRVTASPVYRLLKKLRVPLLLSRFVSRK